MRAQQRIDRHGGYSSDGRMRRQRPSQGILCQNLDSQIGGITHARQNLPVGPRHTSIGRPPENISLDNNLHCWPRLPPKRRPSLATNAAAIRPMSIDAHHRAAKGRPGRW
jgi:hypothetical protein